MGKQLDFRCFKWNHCLAAKLKWHLKFHKKENDMGNLLHYALVFLVIAIVAALFGFGGVAGTAIESAKILFWVAVVLFIISAALGLIRRT